MVSASEIFVSQESDEESKVDHQIALIDPDEFTETGSAFKILNSSLGVITYDVDLTRLVAEIRANKATKNQVDEFETKTIFVISREDYELLSSICTGQTAQSQAKKSYDD